MPAPEILGQLLVRVIELEATAAAVNNTVLLLAKSIDERRDAQEALAHVIAGQELVITVLLRLLDAHGAVPAQEAITALEGVRETLSDENKKGPRATALDAQIEVLKSLALGQHRTAHQKH
jgi:hypothetical protein